MQTEENHKHNHLKVDITEINAAKKSIKIEVASDEVGAEYDKACRKYTRNLKVPGFRQGKVPMHIITQRFGREIEQETVEHVIEHAVSDVMKDAGLKPLRAPVLKDYSYNKGEALVFTAEVEVKPKVAVQGRAGIKVKIAESAVTDRMVADALETLRERAARFEPVEGRALQPGDFGVLDLKARFVAGEGEDFSRENLLIEIGPTGPHPELTEHVTGMQPKDVREFEVSYPGDHPSPDMAGRRITYVLALREIKRKELPALDDDFARDLGKFGTLEDLKRAVEADLGEREKRRARETARGQVIDQLVAGNPDIPVPDVMVDEEVDRRVDELVRSMVMQGMDPRRAAVDWDEIRDKQREPAARSVRAMILLDAIAEEEKISVGADALDQALSEEAARRRQTVEALRAKLTKDGRLERLEQQLLREKVLDFLLVASNT